MTWTPGAYERFRGFRLRPALDLISAIPPFPDEGCVVDLGCGAGAAAEALATAFPGRNLLGVDSSAEMLADLRGPDQIYTRLYQEDLRRWKPTEPVGLIFSNAALQWVPDHETVIPKLFAQLERGGTLAVQMPHQNAAPSHRLWLELAERLFGATPRAMPAAETAESYHRLLSGLGAVSLWETEYYQALPAETRGHPVRRFTESTFGAAVLQTVSVTKQRQLIDAYDAEIEQYYPRNHDGSVVFPFRRLFFTVTRDPRD